MGLPSKKLTKSSKRRRASHFALRPVAITKCTKCKKPVRPHHVCQFCGTYAGREVIKIKSKLDKNKKKKKEEKDRTKEEERKNKKK